METPKTVLILGSAAIKIAEAAEFDYSGSQALKACKEEGIKTILVNPNVATIQTTHKLADRVYLLPLKTDFLEKVIELERPDGILLGFGGQTALSLGVRLHDLGVLERYGVKVLGTPIEGIRRALNRGLFRETMINTGLPIPPSRAVSQVNEALEVAKKIGYPVIVRVSFNLGGRGSFVAYEPSHLYDGFLKSISHSEVRQVLIEKFLDGWKEVEFEVIRDCKGNSVAVTCLENVDSMGIHTGDSIVVAPSQTLTNREYQTLRLASLKVADAINLIGEGNVQLALSPESESYYVIETNPRMSRSSALASKATGYPLAYISAKLALGYTLPELKNSITGITTACFEPSLDYVIVKIPRWDFQKFQDATGKLGSEMQSIGEVMAIGRNLEEAFQKAVRMLDLGLCGLTGGEWYEREESLENVLSRLKRREPYWFLSLVKAIRLGANIDELSSILKIDKFYIYMFKQIVDLSEKLRFLKHLEDEDAKALIAEAKRLGFSDKQISLLSKVRLDDTRSKRLSSIGLPVVRQIDTVAAEWPARTNYLYVTYNGYDDDIDFESNRRKILILGAGVFRIGVSVEFDWAVVNFAQAARKLGYEAIIINYNPETVSTDWDFSDRLYFEEISLERVMDIYLKEKPLGVITFTGGQITNNIARKLELKGATILGTNGSSIDIAEDRAKFSKLLDRLGISQPPWIEASSLSEALQFADYIGFPVIVRPSYVLSGDAMKIAHCGRELKKHICMATKISKEHPVIISKFIEDAIEVEVDAVSDSRSVVGVILEHIEKAGVHSGDSTMVTPANLRLNGQVISKIKDISVLLARELNIRGPFNLQFLIKDNRVYVIELNLRASRSMPFSSKSRGFNLMELAAKITLDNYKINFSSTDFYEPQAKAWAVKSPQFSWAQIRGAYPCLGPEMKSTGEVASLASIFEDALLKSWLSAHPNKLPGRTNYILIYTLIDSDKGTLMDTAKKLMNMNFNLVTIENSLDGIESITMNEAENLVKIGRVDLLITSGSTPEFDYRIRRLAADLNVPMILDLNLGEAIANALEKIGVHTEFEVKELSEYWCHCIKPK